MVVIVLELLFLFPFEKGSRRGRREEKRRDRREKFNGIPESPFIFPLRPLRVFSLSACSA